MHQLNLAFVFFNVRTPVEVPFSWSVLYLLWPTFIAESGCTTRTEPSLEIGAITEFAFREFSHLLSC